MSLKLKEIFILLLFTSISLADDILNETIKTENQQLRQNFITEKLEKLVAKLDQIEAKIPKEEEKDGDYQEIFDVIEDQKDIIYVMKMTASLSPELVQFKIFSISIINRQPFPPMEERTKEKLLEKESKTLKESVKELQSKIAEFDEGDPFENFLEMFDDENGIYSIIQKKIMKEEDVKRLKTAIKNTQKEFMDEGKMPKSEFQEALDLLNEQLHDIKQIDEIINDIEKVPKKSVLSRTMNDKEYFGDAKNETSFKEKLEDIYNRVTKKQTIERGIDGFVEVLALLSTKNDYSADEINTLTERRALNGLSIMINNAFDPIVIPIVEAFYNISKFDGGIRAVIGTTFLQNFDAIFKVDVDETSIKAMDLLSRCINELTENEKIEIFYESELLYYFSESLKKDNNELKIITLEVANKLIPTTNEKQILKLADSEIGVACGLCHAVKDEDQKIAATASDILLFLYKNSGDNMIDVKHEILKCDNCGNISDIINDME